MSIFNNSLIEGITSKNCSKHNSNKILSDYKNKVMSKYNDLEASKNNVDINTIHQTDYNSYSFILNIEKELDNLNNEFFKHLKEFKYEYVKYNLRLFNKWDPNNCKSDIKINTNNKSYDYIKVKKDLDEDYKYLLSLKYRIFVNLEALNKEIASNEKKKNYLLNKYKKKQYDNLNDLDAGMKKLLSDNSDLYKIKFTNICNLSIVGLIICYCIYYTINL